LEWALKQLESRTLVWIQQAGEAIQGECSTPGKGPGLAWEAVDGLFIVRFQEYRMAAEHRQSLLEGLEGIQQDWLWVDRSNAAAQFPTDFGLLRIADAALPDAKACTLCSLHAACS
jgi:hypothetical protein